jgi:hypothetical protein
MGEVTLSSIGEGVENSLSQYEGVIREMKDLLDDFGGRVKYSDLEGTDWKKLEGRRVGISMFLLGNSGMSPEQRERLRRLREYYNEDICGRIVH